MKKPKAKAAVTMPITLPIAITPEEADRSYRNRLNKLYGPKYDVNKEKAKTSKYKR